MQELNKTKKLEESTHYCIFEKRICRWADKHEIYFECKAPSDEEMTCRK